MTLTVHRTGARVPCDNDTCRRFIGIINEGQIWVKNGDQMVITSEASVVCKCGYVNHVALRDDATS